jgi:hypothetical protein
MSNFALNFNMFCDMIDQIIDYNKDLVARKGSIEIRGTLVAGTGTWV